MAQITNKKYRCTKCRHESTQATNHYGATWSVGTFDTCTNCPPYAKYPQYGGQTVWECIEQPKQKKEIEFPCVQIKQHSMRNVGKTHKTKCGKSSKFTDDNRRSLCEKHFKRWFKKTYKIEYSEFIKTDKNEENLRGKQD